MGYLFLLEIGVIAAHIAANKHHFSNIFFSFAITFILKKIMKSMEEKEKAGLVGLAGYSIMLSHVILYFADVMKASKSSSNMGIDFEEFMKKAQIENSFNLDKNFKLTPKINPSNFLK